MENWTKRVKSNRSVAVCFIYLVLATYYTISDECLIGLKTPGRTEPPGDIILEHGNSLRILCVLNQTYMDESYPGNNASNLVFFHNQKEVQPEFITVINETTITLDVELPPPSDDMYYCRLRLENNNPKKDIGVCFNRVVVGFPPKEPHNFHCISHNWENLYCSWEPVKNYVSTTYSLKFGFPGRSGSRKFFPCPTNPKLGEQQSNNSCLWDSTTNPIYRQPYQYYTFILTGHNVLGNFSKTYRYHHYANIIPARPVNLSVINKTTESALLYWSVPYPMENFPPGLHYKIMLQNHWDRPKVWQTINITGNVHLAKRYYNLTDLPYANGLYDVRVYIKSALASDDGWGNYSVTTFRTSSKLPGSPPRTNLGSFEIIERNGSRDVTLYWQPIPKHLENGDNFQYDVIGNVNGRKIEPANIYIAKTHASFKALSFDDYQFEIFSENIVGRNEHPAVIFVPSQHKLPREPISFTKVAFDDRLYELSWQLSMNERTNEQIRNFTIFWCENKQDRPYQCTGYLDWKYVSANTTVINMTVPDPSKVYQFAISVNTNHGSSGMMWSSCTVIHNNVIAKMKSVWINHIGSDYIEIGWQLACSDRGNLQGFVIHYCPIVSPLKVDCKDEPSIRVIKGDMSTIRAKIDNLKPYTTYKVSVAINTTQGEGISSDYLYNTTLEAAPSTPPRDIKISKVTNTTMFIEWKEPEAMNGVLRYYEVHYNQFMQKVEEGNNVTLNNLLAFNKYNVSVAACTVSCSKRSSPLYQATLIGVPGRVNAPIIRFINSSQVIVKWDKPQDTAGPVHYYEIRTKDQIYKSNKTKEQLPFPDCNNVDHEEPYWFQVRAVNIAGDSKHLKGPWSDVGEGNCYNSGISANIQQIMLVIGSSAILFLVCGIAYAIKRIWHKYRDMQDVEVKLPPGLAPNMKLLQKISEPHIRQPSADSSGCSSGQESVTSSLTADSQVSGDSGTEVDPMSVPPDKLLETLPAWESSNLRQRNVAIMRPDLNEKAEHWNTYVKVAKSGEPISSETLSLAHSTPNLTDSTGYTTSQQTWSSTGYISMPSSEELSSNPSPVLNVIGTTVGGNYSVVGIVPKPIRTKSEDDTGVMDGSIGSVEVPLASISEANVVGTSTIPYVTLAALEQKIKEQKQQPVDAFRDLEHLTFVESNKMDTLPSHSNVGWNKPYVRTTCTNTLPKPFIRSPTDSVKNSTIRSSIASTSLTDSCNKPFMSSYAASPSPLNSAELPSLSTKSYIALTTIPETTRSSPRAADGESSLLKFCSRQIPATSDSSSTKPYLPAAYLIQRYQRKENDENDGNDGSDGSDGSEELLPLPESAFWEDITIDAKEASDKPNPDNLTRTIITANQNIGFVTVADKLNLKDLDLVSVTGTSHVRFDKSSPVATADSQSTDEQYSKVAVVPSTIV